MRRINALFLEKQENGILLSDGSNSVYKQRANDLQSIINERYREVKEIQNRCNRYRSLSRRTADDRDIAEHKMRKTVEAIDAMTDDHNSLIQFYHSVMKEKEEAEKELGAEVNALDNGRAAWNRRLQDIRSEIRRLQKVNAQQEREKQSKAKQRQVLMLQKRKDDERLQEKERIKYLESYREELLAELDEAEHTWTELQIAAGGADTPDGIVARYAEMKNRNSLLKDLLRIATKKRNRLQVELQQVASVDVLECAQIADSRNIEHKEICTIGMASDFNSQTLEAINSAKRLSDKNCNNDHRTLGGHEKYDLNVTAIDHDLGKISATADMCLRNLVNLLEIGKQHVIGKTEQNSEQNSHRIQIDGIKSNDKGKSKTLCQDIDNHFGSRGTCSRNSVIGARRMSACDLTATRSGTKRGSLVIPDNKNISESLFIVDSVGSQVGNGEETALHDGATLMNMAEETKRYIEDLLPQLERTMTEKVSDKSGNALTSIIVPNMQQIQNIDMKCEAKSHKNFHLDVGDSEEEADSTPEAPGERRFDEIKTGEEECTFHEILIQNDVLKEIQNIPKYRDTVSSLSGTETGNQLPVQQPRVHEDGNSPISTGANHFEKAKELFEPTNLCISAYSVMEHSFGQEQCFKHTLEPEQFSPNKEDFESNVCNESSDPQILHEPILHDKRRAELANTYFARLLGAVLSPPERHFDPFVVVDNDEGDRTGQIWDRASVKGRSRRILNSVEGKAK